MKRIEKISIFATELQNYIKTIIDGVYVSAIYKAFDDPLWDYADLLIFNNEGLAKIKELKLDHTSPLTKEDIEKIEKIDNDVYLLTISFSTGYAYGCIPGNSIDYKSTEKHCTGYLTGPFIDSEGLDLSLFSYFTKSDIDTSVVPKDSMYFTIISTVHNFMTIENMIKVFFNPIALTVADSSQAEEKPVVTASPYESKTREEIFKKELDLISSETLKWHVIRLLYEAHENNFIKAASSTGKYHPAHENGEGGMIRHTKCVVRFAQEIMRGFPEYDSTEKSDIVYAACILHDMDKYNSEHLEHTDPNHPLSMMKKVIAYAENISSPLYVRQVLFEVARLIGSHHGRWTDIKTYSNGKANIIGYLPYPEDRTAWVVHMADLMASRQFVHVNFDANNDIIG